MATGQKQTVAGIATRDEILQLLSDAARKGHVGAMRLMLEEIRHDGDRAATSSVIDELSTKRRNAAGR